MHEHDERVPVWSALQRRLHWLVAALVLGQYLLQGPMRRAGEAVAEGAPVTFGQFLVTTLHTWGGAGVALLVLWRIRLRRGRAVPTGGGRLGPRLARWVGWHHALLYAVLLAMALSGALHYYAGVESAARWHEIGKWLLAALVTIHAAAALVHGLRPGDTVLRRMWRGRDDAADVRD